MQNILTPDWVSTDIITTTMINYFTERTIQALFEAQVVKTPNNVALVYEGISVTYLELNQRSNQLAYYLRTTYAIKGDDLVALCLDRSELMLIAILALLKSGAAYVPIDPNYPQERIQYILQDTQAKIVLTNKCYEKKIQAALQSSAFLNLSPSIELIDSEKIKNQFLTQPNQNLSSIITHKNLAYVIYTSGTTGKPKGVMIEHHSLVNLAVAQSAAFGLSQVENKHYLSCVNYIFDGQISDVFITMIHGHTFHLANEIIRADIIALQQYIINKNISWAHVPPILLSDADLLSLETLIVAGDKTSEKILKAYSQQGTHIINAYGPTESTVCASLHHYFKGDLPTNIGKPLANNTLYVLDSDLNFLQPNLGLTGELYIGGAGVARGYLNQPELTAGRFIFNPFQTDQEKANGKNARLYKTGDLVRYLPDGDLEFVGRNDFQVKIRGFRIELNEIERCLLLSDSSIQHAIVITHKQEMRYGAEREIEYLVGYYVSPHQIKEDVLLAFLETYLPDYMIPATLVWMKKFPLTANGKLDRDALVVPTLNNREHYVPPRHEKEAKICAIFAKILGLPPAQVGIRDDFFRLGGDSIMSIQIVCQLRQQLGIHLHIKDIFSCRNIERLYNQISRLSTNEKKEELSESGFLWGELSFLPIQQWFFDRVSRKQYMEENYYNQSFLIKTPVLELERLEKALNELIAYHDAFRLQYSCDADGRWHQYYKEDSPAISLQCLNIQTLGAPEGSAAFEERLNSILTNWQQGFSLEEKSLYCVAYITGYADGSSRIYMALHHLIVDAVSWRFLMDDLRMVYYNTDEGLGTKGTSYRQWSEVIKQYPQKYPEEVVYWKSLLSEFSNNLDIFKTQLNDDLTENQRGFFLDAVKTRQLLTESHRAFHTEINDLLLTGLGLALSDLTQTQIHYIAVEGHGREAIDPRVNISRTLGWFTTIYPICLSIQQEDIGKSIQSVKEYLRSIPNKGIGFGAIRGYDDNELPKITFNYLGQLDRAELADVDWRIVNESSGKNISEANWDDDVIKITGFVIEGQLSFNIVSRLKPALLEKFVIAYQDRLKELIQYTIKIKRRYLTSSDIDHILTPKYLQKLQQAGDIDAVYLANSLQQGFIYHALNQGKTDDAYRVQMILEYHIALEQSYFKRAWEYAQVKYPSLRLRFAWDEEVVQIIDREAPLDWRYIDLTHHNISKREEIKSSLLISDRQEIYHLNEGKLLRVYLIQETETQTTCILSCHHIMMDGWSYPPLLDYVHKIYTSLVEQKSPNIQSIVPEQCYGDAQKYIKTMDFSDDEQFWKKELARLGTPADLSGWLKEECRTIQLSHYKHIFDSQEQKLVIDGIIYQSLKKFSQDAGITLNTICQYVWHKLLHIYGNTSTTVVGTTLSGRGDLPVNDIECSVGLYINTLPLIIEHQPEISIIDALHDIQNRVNQLNAHSYVYLAKLQTAGQRLFDNLFVFENYPMPVSENNTLLSFHFVQAIEKLDYPLAFSAQENNGALFIALTYAGELFHSATIENILKRFSWILEQVIKTPEQKQGALNYLMLEEKQRIIYEQNNAWQDCLNNQNQTIHELFEAQVIKTPNNIALVYEGLFFTYQELNQRANQLAHYLHTTYSIQGDDLIALCLDRSELVLIAILGVLKSGAAYVPIDSNYPEERIQHILQDTQAKAILTNENHSEKLFMLLAFSSPMLSISIECIDSLEIQKKLLTQSKENFSSMITHENLAYIIYTSGTTGQPKGVMIEHHSLVNLAITQSEAFGLSQVENKHYLSCVNYVFDGQISDIFITILHGHTFHLASETIRGDITLLQQYVTHQKISWAHIPPVLLDEKYLLSLETLIVAGDKTNENVLNAYCRQGIHVINAYGPTESTVCASLHNYILGDIATNIGKPLAHVLLYVLDTDLMPLPQGAIGELYIGGTGLARGYLNQSELTKNTFVVSPFQTNARLYKTGDLVRYLSNGDLEFMGRNDFQVKIRGFRIELNEIENCLLQSDPAIQQAVIVTQKKESASDEGVSQYLVGYYVSSEKLNEEILLGYLARYLPEYMVPVTLVWLEKLPLTTNGKLDRNALVAPVLTNPEHYIAPRNDREAQMCAIFSEVLELPVENVGIKDDFFRLGGDSILAIKVVNQLSTHLGLNLSINDLFQFKTIEEMLVNMDEKSVDNMIIPRIDRGNE